LITPQKYGVWKRWPPEFEPTIRPKWTGYFVSPKDFVKNFTKFLQEIHQRDFIRTAMPQARIREWPLLAEVIVIAPPPLRTF
jgi:hypothetical protein